MTQDSTGENSTPKNWQEAVAQVYSELEQDLAPHGDLCKMRGICCDFEKVDHRLYASEIEIQYLLQTKQVSWNPEGKLCPFWQNGVCKARTERPLGCRTYFCAASWEERGAQLYEKYLARLTKISKNAGIEYSYSAFVDRLRSLAKPNP